MTRDADYDKPTRRYVEQKDLEELVRSIRPAEALHVGGGYDAYAAGANDVLDRLLAELDKLAWLEASDGPAPSP